MSARRFISSASDVRALVGLFNQWDDVTEPMTEDYFEEKCKIIETMPNSLLAVCEDDEGRVRGYAYFTEVLFLGLETFVELQSILVDSSYRGKGFGRKLVSFGEKWAREKGYSKIALSSRVHLEKAHSFYRALGYREYKRSVFFEKKL